MRVPSLLHTGKTIMLVLQGLRWLLQGRDVYVVSICPDCLAASVMIQHQLQMTLRDDPTASPSPGTVRLHQYDLRHDDSDVDRAVSILSSALTGDTQCVLMDETGSIHR